MTRYILGITGVLLTLVGCGTGKPDASAAISINGIEFTASEFEQAYETSSYAQSKLPDSRAEFLDTFVKSKLLLSAALQQGLDKDPDFLEDVESFWNQSLLKLALDQQMKQVSAGLVVSDAEIQGFYEARKAEYFAGVTLEQSQEAIKTVLLREKRQQALESWINSLERRAQIEIDYGLLKIPAGSMLEEPSNETQN
ncbi:MAG: hypothetical protein JW937_01475 [Candidatus Omnitrophica bacterium]|nr:hypothetical protein [Candidatus Omnitrophota bacterium]